ncbi:MAG TPA: hypothetical protein ENI51_01120 [Candidatus Atribacteria bacterium]|nr:hypothetical protein [Candidatus Atribacteria bacterium]
MNKKMFLIFVMLVLATIPLWTPIATVKAIDQQPGLLKPGDIILVHCKNAGIWGTFYWCHAMLYIGNGLIIHSDGDGVHTENLYHELNDLENRFGEIENTAYLRVKSSLNPDISAVISFAQEKEEEGRPYDMWSQFVFPSKQKNPQDPSKPWWGYYCTELIWAAYMESSDDRINIEYTPDYSMIHGLEIYWRTDVLDRVFVTHEDEVPPPPAD